jgi:hypothetical protein
MHGDVKQEDLYQNCEFHYPQGRGFAPRAGSNMMCNVCAHLNIFNFLIATTPILFKFDMMHLWDNGDINCEFQVSYPPGALGGVKSIKRIFSQTTCL